MTKFKEEGGTAMASGKSFSGSFLNHRLLTAEEEVMLAIRIERGDEQAREELIKHNLRLVHSWAMNFWRQNPSVGDGDDFVNQGVVILIRFVDKINRLNGFNWRSGYKFSTLFRYYFRQQMLVFIKRNRRAMGIPFGEERIAEELSPEKEPLEAVIEKEEFQQKEKALTEGWALLNEKEADIVSRYFGINFPKKQSLRKISDHYGLSPERIRQIKKKALAKIKWAAALS